jgi:YihY family inner membrane protein
MPHDVKPVRWWTPFGRALTRWSDADGEQGAAALAYYVMVSILPLAILLVTAGSLFVPREAATREVVRLAHQFTPLTTAQQQAAAATIRGLLEERGTISLVAMALLTVGALQFLRTLIRTTNRIWRSPASTWWRVPAKSFALLGITATAVVAGILLPVGMRWARPWLATTFGVPTWVFPLAGDFMPWLVLFYGFVMIYKLAPSRPTTFAEVWQGALGATVLIWTGERLFLLYATNIARFNVLYGTLGAVVALLLWVLISSGICVFGVCFCAAQAEARAERSVGER